MAQYAPTVPRFENGVYLVIARDPADGSSAEKRDRQLEGHLEYVEKRCNDYLVCGPIWNDASDAIIGSFFMIEAADADAAREIVNGDPYVDAGTYERIDVHPVTASAGRFMGGVIWESADTVRARTG